MEYISSDVRVENQETEEFIVRKGLRQGDPLSALLFNLVLEGVIRSSGINRQGTLNTKSHQCLAYANDVILMANSNKELSRITTNLIEEGAKMGLQINQGKTEYMQLKNKHAANETLTNNQ